MTTRFRFIKISSALSIACALTLFLAACSDSTETAEPTPTPTSTPSPSPTPTDIGQEYELGNGVLMTIDADGTGEKAATGERVWFVYDLISSDGTQIESHRDNEAPMSLVIGEPSPWETWAEALANLRLDGEATLTLPEEILQGFLEDSSNNQNSSEDYTIRLRRVSMPDPGVEIESRNP